MASWTASGRASHRDGNTTRSAAASRSATSSRRPSRRTGACVASICACSAPCSGPSPAMTTRVRRGSLGRGPDEHVETLLRVQSGHADDQGGTGFYREFGADVDRVAGRRPGSAGPPAPAGRPVRPAHGCARPGRATRPGSRRRRGRRAAPPRASSRPATPVARTALCHVTTSGVTRLEPRPLTAPRPKVLRLRTASRAGP